MVEMMADFRLAMAELGGLDDFGGARFSGRRGAPRVGWSKLSDVIPTVRPFPPEITYSAKRFAVHYLWGLAKRISPRASALR
jgi:hypothetical protein